LAGGIYGKPADKSANGEQVASGHRNLTISVNLSAKQFLQPKLVEDIGKLLSDLSLPPEVLKLEITESTVMGDPTAAVEMLQTHQIAWHSASYR